MSAKAGSFWKALVRRGAGVRVPALSAPTVDGGAAQRVGPKLSPTVIARDDPILVRFQKTPGAVDIRNLDIESPALRALKRAGIELVVPLTFHGDLIGLLNLGPRLSQQAYSPDDRDLLNNLAAQAAPAVRVAQLIRRQREEAHERQRIEQEMQVARLIQQTLLPKSVPVLGGWHLAAHYRPAREVGGDFYDFIELEGGCLGLIVGDVTDKGFPAALVMATARSVMRAAAAQFPNPGSVLVQANALLCPTSRRTCSSPVCMLSWIPVLAGSCMPMLDIRWYHRSGDELQERVHVAFRSDSCPICNTRNGKRISSTAIQCSSTATA